VSADQYIAGQCNIGKAEVRQRQIVALVGLFFSVSALIGFISTSASPSLRLGIFLPLTVFSRKKFCLAYGLMGTFNFNRIGKVSKVTDGVSLKADRAMALSILVQSIALAGVLTLIVYLLPLN
jgi:hypothetical protein